MLLKKMGRCFFLFYKAFNFSKAQKTKIKVLYFLYMQHVLSMQMEAMLTHMEDVRKMWIHNAHSKASTGFHFCKTINIMTLDDNINMN